MLITAGNRKKKEKNKEMSVRAKCFDLVEFWSSKGGNSKN